MLDAQTIDELQEQARTDARKQLVAEMLVGGAATVFRPGDKIVLRVPTNLQHPEIARLRKFVSDFFGDNAKNVLILPSDIEIYALRQESED